MSYTNLELVNRHINFEDFDSGFRKDYPLVFENTDWVELPGRALSENSVKVKAVFLSSPRYEELILNETEIDLAYSNLIPNTVVIASDKSLGRIFSEPDDFTVDYANGRLKRTPDSDIAGGNSVSIWYGFFHAYVEDSDFEVDYGNGRIRLLDTGSMSIGQNLFVDYAVSSTQFNDEIISRAVDEADSIIKSEIDDESDFGADPALETAATYLAVSIVCRMAAATDLKRTASSRYSSAPWISLSESYRADYELIVSRFRRDRSRLSRPTKTV